MAKVQIRKYEIRDTKYDFQAPSLGIALFFALYIYAASLYPGGSQADLHSQGFDWVNNYWCNLLNAEAMNGEPNPSRPWAIAAMGVLCISMALFFYRIPERLPLSANWRKVVQWSGLSAMSCSFFLFTSFHDEATSLGSFFGLFALIGIFVGLYRLESRRYFHLGVFCALLMAVNNYIYYTHQGLFALPLLQKISFVVVLGWVLMLNRKFFLPTQFETKQTARQI